MSIPAEFATIKTFEGWQQKLATMIAEGMTLAQADAGGDAAALNKIIALTKRMTDFQKYSDPAISGTDDLDTIAAGTSDDLLNKAANTRVLSLQSRSNALEVLSKQLGAQTAQDKQAAASMRADNLSAMLDSVHSAIQAGSTLAKSLDSATDQQFAAQLQTALQSLADLQAKLHVQVIKP